jgi:hypothetical protein
MRKLVSFVLGGALLFGAALLPSGTATARDRHDRNNWHHHKHHHHRHHYKRNRLSY